MQPTLERPTTSPPTVSEADALRAASQWVATSIDPAFAVVSGALVHHPAPGREVWQFVIRCEYGPLDAIEVDAQTGAVLPLPDDKIRVIREKAAIYAARKRGIAPINEHGYVLGEYARRRAERYLGDQLAMCFNAAHPVFVPDDPPRWQVTIVFQRYQRGPFTLGIMDVNAKTGEPIPLTKPQLKRIRERAHALVAIQTQPAAA